MPAARERRQQVTRARVSHAAVAGRRAVQHDVGEAGDALEALRAVEVGQDGNGAAGAPVGELRRIAQEREDAVTGHQGGKGAAGDVAGADDQ